jgi:hypothetical protein
VRRSRLRAMPRRADGICICAETSHIDNQHTLALKSAVRVN